MQWIKNALTGKDNETHDVVRLLGALSGLIGLGLTVYTVVWKSAPFDLQSYGIGIGALLGGIGAALWAKKDTEPEAK